MVVQHNLQAMNSNRMLGITSKAVSNSTEKLSSGYKINRAADDAAGLSISEKMRKQIRGLSQASSNAEDGISSVQTAEGALQEVTDMLQRMNELAVQAANGTNSMTDRQYIQDELDQLVTEIDRVSETTKFNETYLLKGDASKGVTKQITANYSVTYTKNHGSNGGTGGVENKIDYTGNSNVYMVSASIFKASSTSPISADVISSGDDFTKYLDKAKVGTNATLDTGTGNFAINKDFVAFQNTALDVTKLKYDDTKNVIAAIDDKTRISAGTEEALDVYILNTDTNEITKVDKGTDLTKYLDKVETKSAGANGSEVTFAEMKENYRMLTVALADLTHSSSYNDSAYSTYSGGKAAVAGTTLATKDFKGNESMQKLYDSDGKEVSGIALSKYFDEKGNYAGGLYTTAQATTAVTTGSGVNCIDNFIKKNSSNVTNDLNFSIHVGADSTGTNKIEANIKSMSSSSLGIDKLKSTSVGIVDDTGANATDAVDIISDALQKVSTQRSALGAVQNRLEHTIKNLDNVVENTQSAESAIRDTDMATEAVRHSNANILAQAGQSMLAQANQSNQGALALL